MQAKENHQQFNKVKENLLPVNDQLKSKIQLTTKSNALQPTKKGISINVQSNAQQQLKSNSGGLQVSKQIVNNNQPRLSNEKKQQLNTKGIQGKIGQQKENGRQSLKPIKNEIVDNGKIKKVALSKQNSNSKLNKKIVKKSSTSNDGQKAIKKESAKQSTKPAVASKKESSNELDFVIFCDENDELAIIAVEKENNVKEEQKSTVDRNEKKKGLAERNIKQQQQQNLQVNLQATANVQQLVTQISTQTTITHTATTAQQQQNIINIQSNVQNIKSTNEDLKSNIELIKEAVVPIDNLTLDETLDDCTLNEQSTIENKENDPTLMSIDLSKYDELEVDQENLFKDVSGDMSCKEFSNEIYIYMLERELKFLPDPVYMSKQPEINSKMRAMLVDWLIDVGIEYELENETVFLTISYVDQFLSSLTISLQNFQLLGKLFFKLIKFAN